MATRYFKTDNRRMTWRECWDMSPGLGGILLLGAKLLGLRWKFPGGSPVPESEREYVVSPEELLPQARERMAPMVARLEALGFHSPVFVTPKDSLMPGVYVAVATLLHRSGEMLGYVAYMRATMVYPGQEHLHVGFETRLADGRVVGTGTERRRFQPVAGCEGVSMPGRSAEEVYQRHLQRLAAPGVRAALERIEDESALWAHRDETNRRTNEERVARGVWVWMTPEEVAAARASHPSPPPVPDTAPRQPGEPPPLPPDPDDPVLVELEKLQHPKQRWGTVALLFGVSLAMFIVAGWLQWSWEFALMLVPILFFHELGHYIAMRCFGYRNLRMFFIPFFGAAVSGLRLQVQGWKKAVIALAGPVPGIVIGAGLAFVAWRTGEDWMRKLARLLVIVNGFNLLPLVPLDGGRVFDAVFYVRSRSAETVALVLAAAGMLALSIALSARALMFVGIVMFIGMPHLLRVARVTERVRRNGFTPDPEDAPAISREAAKAILPEVRAALPAAPPMGPKPIAQIVMNVYERLHTTAPGWPASVAVLLAHGAAVALTLLALVWEPVMRHFEGEGETSRKPKAVATPLVFDCASETRFGGNTGAFPSNRVTIVATSPDRAELREAFDVLLAADTNAALTLCGRTLFIAATNAGRAWESMVFRKLTGEQTATVLERRGTAGPRRRLVIHVRATAPDEEAARRLEGELKGRFEASASGGESSGSGVVERDGRQVGVSWLQFDRLDRGLPVLLGFLCEQGCAPVRYGMEPASAE